MDKDTRAIIDSLEFIRERMLTRDELPEIVRPIIREEIESLVPGIVARQMQPIDHRLMSIEHELHDVNRRLDHLEEQFSNIKGVTKEIDELRDRIREIEKHLGLNRRIAA